VTSQPLPADPWTLTAHWIIPVDGPPLERGTITIAGERIVAVEPQGQRAADRDLGNVAILPGFVNAHTHLDLSGLRGQIPPTADFTAWLRTVIEHRRGQTPEQIEADIRTGLNESLQYGTTLLADIAAAGQSWAVLKEEPARAVVFYELLGLPLPRAEESLAIARAWLEQTAPTATCRPGLSPHAPYSVRDWLFGQAAKLASQLRLPLTTHLGETTAEYELLQNHRGSLVEFLSEVGVWDAEGLVSFPEEVCFLYQDRSLPRLFAHANYADATLLALTQSSVVYCPRTHAAFKHSRHPFREFLSRGIRVALGTDSLASNPDLDVLAEARFLHEHYDDVPTETVLRMATLRGAQVLGWADETGSLTPGKSADLVVLPLPDEEKADPYALVLQSSQKVRSVLCRGRWVAGAP
jgi:cytosine/adenosine deaminase-related metal-dependent hydrolase